MEKHEEIMEGYEEIYVYNLKIFIDNNKLNLYYNYNYSNNYYDYECYMIISNKKDIDKTLENIFIFFKEVLKSIKGDNLSEITDFFDVDDNLEEEKNDLDNKLL